MNGDATRKYRAQEFAKLAGVTVRTLHHYDRLGLLRPRRTQNRYRAYCERDLERLEQIVALKYLGLPLQQIRALLERDALAITKALRRQRAVLEAKRNLLDKAIDAIRKAESAVDGGKSPDAAILREIIEAIEMQNDTDWMLKYYSDSAKDKVAKKRQEWSPELQERVSREWMELIRDVENALGESPSGEKGQTLAGRWISLIEEFTGGDPGITSAVKNLYADRANWPRHFQKQMQPFRVSGEALQFIQEAIAERKRRQ